MDAFEELAAEILRADGYWVQRSVKIELTPAQKRDLNNPSMPRPELDLVAYKPATGELLAIECKSYLDSTGVHVRDLMPGGRYEHRYKMFTNKALREVVLAALVEQMAAAGMIVGNPKPRLCLIYGHAAGGNEPDLQQWFDDHGWTLQGPDWLTRHLGAMAARSYDNQVASIVAKLLLKAPGRATRRKAREAASRKTPDLVAAGLPA